MGKRHIEVHGYDGLLFAGDGEIHALEGDYQWAVEFIVPNTQVAQFQMRRGERVSVCVDEGRRTAALIQSFSFEKDASFAGPSGHGRIELVGKGDAP